MARKRKTWTEMLMDSKDLPKVVELKENARNHWKAKTMAIPSPMEVNEIMASVPAGSVITMDEIRHRIARRHDADIGCPLTCGIFAWIAANAAEEQASTGKCGTTAYWRTVKSNGELNPKYPGGAEAQQRRLEAEGHTVVRKGKKLVVAGVW